MHGFHLFIRFFLLFYCMDDGCKKERALPHKTTTTTTALFKKKNDRQNSVIMLGRTFMRFIPAAAAAAVGATGGAAFHKAETLHKLLLGETTFKNEVPLKYCNVVHNFGENWQAELETYARTLPAEEQEKLHRQVSRLLLTRYTTRELAMYCGDGPEKLEENARKANIEQGCEYYVKHGEEKFVAYVKKEAKYANWTESQAQEFIEAVKQEAPAYAAEETPERGSSEEQA